MAEITKPIALDETFNTTEGASRNIADVLAQGIGDLVTVVSRISHQTTYDELSDLEDVNISAPTNGDVLTYDGSKWVNGQGGGGASVEQMIAPVETSTTASQAYAIGEQFILNGTLYTATAAITAGGTITINGNCTASDTVTEQIQDRVLFPNFSVTPTAVDVTPADTSGTLLTMDKNGWVKLAIVKISGSAIGRIRADGNIILSSRAEIQAQDFIPLKKGTVLTYLNDSASTYRYIVQAYYD